ncbi:protein trichome birefringence-like 41 [Neltuma alba]|uniref:protein trichome birefringence-like 41 n=1 Tax=Neltuma alba TaxID=207710 RepID=UPI0010A4479A|nr:protein trichome birefringence-like 41 [Prosopis alba]XP_028789747.1 protein trichome birefringence-like 41 [Prosopis alba]
MGSCGFQRLSSFTTHVIFFSVLITLLNLYKSNAMVVLEQWKESKRDHHDDGDSSGSSVVRRKCDLFEGRWVYDETYPLYKASSCPFIEQEFDCQKNGRPDSFYQKYRWQPNACALPRYKGQDLLRELKGKKILFVGDSLSLNQWQSLICMLHVAAPHSGYSLHRVGGLSTFTLPEYKISVMLSRNALLVDIVKEKIGTVLKLDSVENNGNSWKGYDVIIFNTWHWWLHKGHQQPWEYIQVGNKIEKDMNRLDAFREAIRTWSKWVDSNVNPNITKVFFQSTSPTHYDGEEWNEASSSTCRGQTIPMGGSRYSTGPPKAAVIVKQVLGQMAKPVGLLDITTLSQLRRDGHPSVYGVYGERGNDCSHWCLPGVPDTWNQLLLAMLVNK